MQESVTTWVIPVLILKIVGSGRLWAKRAQRKWAQQGSWQPQKPCILMHIGRPHKPGLYGFGISKCGRRTLESTPEAASALESRPFDDGKKGMADISIRREHGLSLQQAKEAAQQIADRMAGEFQMATEWCGDVLSFRR